MKQFYAFLFVLFVTVTHTHAQFSGSYAPARWQTFLSPVSNGVIDYSGAPASIKITGSNEPNETVTNNVLTQISVQTVAAGSWQFSWSYVTFDSDAAPQYDIAYVIINGTRTNLSSLTQGQVNQNGIYNGTSIPANSVIAFGIDATDNIYGSAELTISGFVPPGGISTLPVSFSSVKATSFDKFVRIDWSTASETHNRYFEVERLQENNTYTSIGTIQAGTNGTSLQEYHFEDKQPLNGTNYYRIKQVDIDGKYSYSGIVQAKWFNDSPTGITVLANPLNNVLQVRLSAAKPVELRLYTMTGALLKTWMITGNQLQSYDLSNLVSGMYLLQTGDGKLSKKIIKK
jgi:hypothetical protein